MTERHKLFQILRAGTFTAMSGVAFSFSEIDLRMSAGAFDPKRQAAPLVLGHPQDDKPGYGEVTGLFVKDGGLYAQAVVDAALEAMVKSGRYRKVSAAFFPPYSSQNPTPGAYYLKHVGFLGAMAPAVKGLEPLGFTESRGRELCFSESETITLPQTSASPVRAFLYDPERLSLHHLASEYCEVCPSLSYAEAVTLAHGALTF